MRDNAIKHANRKIFRFASTIVLGLITLPVAAADHKKPAEIAIAPPQDEPGYSDGLPLDVVLTRMGAVPSGLSVIYGTGVDKNTPTTWKGSSDWETSLANALTPLGYKHHLTHGQVEIVTAATNFWKVTRGVDLAVVFRQWCDQAGSDVCGGVVWKSPYHYPVEGAAEFRGTFEQAVDQALQGFSRAPRPPKGTLSSNRVLIIEAQDDHGGG